MRLRISKVSEHNMLLSLKHKVWGANRDIFSSWQIGDFLLLKVGPSYACLTRIAGEPYLDESTVWDNGIYPHRISLEIVAFYAANNREAISSQIKDIMIKRYTEKYGYVMQNYMVLDEMTASAIYNVLMSASNQLKLVKYKSKIDDLIKLLDNKPSQELDEHNKSSRLEECNVNKGANERDKKTEREHTKAQYLISSIGRIGNCDIFIANNDRGDRYQNTLFKDISLPKLPDIGVSPEAVKIISRIDVLWLDDNNPIYAFEIETTTNISDGLLRMADLLSACPALKIQFVIIAPVERKKKFLDEVCRRAFNHKGFLMKEKCRFLSIEDLEDIYKVASEFPGAIKPSIILSKAISA